MRSLKNYLVLGLMILPISGIAEEYLIKVKFSEVKLYLIKDGKEMTTFPVAVPSFIPKILPIEGKVVRIGKNPYWYPTERSKERYSKKHKEELPKAVKPGDPRNAMGVAEIVIEFKTQGVNPLIRIHGTNDANSIGHRITSGCIRMLNKDILTLIEIINGKPTQILFEK